MKFNPMLADNGNKLRTDLINSKHFFLDEKLNGERCLIRKTKSGKIIAFGRGKTDGITTRYETKIPTIISELDNIIDNDTILDCELCYFDKNGIEDRGKVRSVCGTIDINESRKKLKQYPLKLVVFDVCQNNGKNLTHLHNIDRRLILNDLCVDDCLHIESSNYCTNDKQAFIETIFNQKREGVIAKTYDGYYNYTGKRDRLTKNKKLEDVDWYKIKRWESSECIVTGFDISEGEKIYGLVGNLYISEKIINPLNPTNPNDTIYIPRGKVGTGFSDEDRIMLLNMFKDTSELFSGNIDERLIVEVEYTNITKKNGYFENSSFKGIRTDKMWLHG